ncbi:hypothetical protein [Kaarinaea lacus]
MQNIRLRARMTIGYILPEIEYDHALKKPGDNVIKRRRHTRCGAARAL